MGYLFTHDISESQGQPLGKRNRKVVSASLATALVASGSPFVASFAQDIQDAARVPVHPENAADQTLNPAVDEHSQAAVPTLATVVRGLPPTLLLPRRPMLRHLLALLLMPSRRLSCLRVLNRLRRLLRNLRRLPSRRPSPPRAPSRLRNPRRSPSRLRSLPRRQTLLPSLQER